jgi:hypothetical protein
LDAQVPVRSETAGQIIKRLQSAEHNVTAGDNASADELHGVLGLGRRSSVGFRRPRFFVGRNP